jgi:hypothetical protein
VISGRRPISRVASGPASLRLWLALYRAGRQPDALATLRTALVAAIRAAYPGLAEVRLTRLEDGSYTDSWRWDSAAQMQSAFPATALPEAQAAMALTHDYTASYGEVIDER